MDSEKRAAQSGLSFSFEGREISYRSGVSLAAALTAAGELELRGTAAGDARGIFCGMGVCQECRVNVDGRSGIRACMTPAATCRRVARESSPVATQADGAPIDNDDNHAILTPELLVIGAGPGGLLAASIAAEAGADVVVLDERSIQGGQYFKQPASTDLIPASLIADKQLADGKALIERTQRSGARVLSGTEVWGAFAPSEFAVFDGERTTIYKPRRVIVATGAYERGLPIPGWTLPGVMTTGAAQSMLRSYGTLAGRRILVAGNGPLNLQVALELQQAGADVVAVAELAARSSMSWLLNGLMMGLSAPGLSLNGIRYVADLKRLGVPVFYGQGLNRIENAPTGLKAWLGPVRENVIDARDSLDVDIVCMGYGFQPSNEILRNLGCRHDYDENRGYLVTDRNPHCETSVSGVYAIGDCCGINGAPVALQDGVIAAIAAIRSLERTVSAQHRKEYKRAVRNLHRHRTFQSALWRIFAAPRLQAELANADTLICRCENVSLADINKAIEDDAGSIGTIKRRTRLGMGACQGRYCAPVVADLLAKRTGRPIGEYSFFAPRSPLKPIRIADIVSAGKA